VSDEKNDSVNDIVNTSHPHKTKKPFTQPATGRQDPAAPGEHQSSSEQMNSSERMNRGGGDQRFFDF